MKNAALVRLLGGFALVNVAEWGFIAALSVYAYQSGGTLYVGLIGLRFLFGALSSALLAPLLASRRGVLSQVAFLRAILLGSAAFCAIAGEQFSVVLLFVVLDALVAAVYRPAQARLMPALARSPQELTQAVAGTSVTKTTGQALGALIGGATLEFVSPAHGMAFEAAVMLCAFPFTLGISGAPAVDTDAAAHGLMQGLKAFPSMLSDRYVWPLVLASVLRTLVRGLWGALLVVVALRLLHASSSSVGLLQAAAGAGAFVALPVTAAQIGRSRLAVPCVVSFAAAGAMVALVGAAQTLAVVAALVFAWGAAMAIADVMSLSLLHRLLSTVAFSRTVAVMESLKLVTEGAGGLLAPVLVALLGLRAALVVAGLPLPLLMFSTWARVQGSDELAAGRGAVVARLHRVKLFRQLDMASLEQLAAHAEPCEISAGAEPIRQGDHGDCFYMIQSGTAEVVINGFPVREIGPDDDFGERALLRDTPRTATVRALTDMTLLRIGRDAFLEAVTGEKGMSVEYRDLLEVPLIDVLRELPAFDRVDAQSLKRLARASQRAEIAEGAVVLDVGDMCDAAHVILQGRVELRQDGRVTAVLVPGDIFGELSITRGTPSSYRAVAATPVIAAVLPAAALLAETNAEAPGIPG